jgi:hypothetical protein
MLWEYLVLGVILVWAVYYVWKTLFRKKGCSCESCPASTRQGCAQQTLGDLRSQAPREEGERRKEEE